MSAKGKSKSRKAQAPARPHDLGKQSKQRHLTSINTENAALGRPYTVIALVLLLLAAGVVWAGPGINIDLWTALAGGRDVAGGYLGKPDNWSFITGGRVWLDQNWGSGLLFYLWQRALGNDGLLWLKGILIADCALFTLLAARRRKIRWPVALLSTAFIIIAIRNYIYLRPNIMTLVCAPLELWLLYRTLERPARIWQVAGLMVLWANLHGGFIFGLGVMALWTGCVLISSLITAGMEGFKRYWQFIPATVAAILLTGLANPFGFNNLTHPFLMLTEEYWRNVAEWQPILGANFDFGNTWEFFAVIGVIGVFGFLRIMGARRERRAASGLQSPGEPVEKTGGIFASGGVIIFEALLFLVLVFMAFESRRFIPLALILSLPVLGMQTEWLAGRVRSRWAFAIIGFLVLLLTGSQLHRTVRYYHPNNPLSTPEPFFEKMNLAYHFFPAPLARFVNDNRIEGNIFSNWEWEGYLRWNCPQLKVFVGGRAQQVYQASEYQLYQEILTSETPADELKRLKVHLVACSYSGIFTNLINRLVTGGRWVVIFNDNYHTMLADAAWPEARALMDVVPEGRLTYPGRAIGLLSRASYIVSPAVDEERPKAIELLKQAVKPQPLSKAYLGLANFIFAESNQTRDVVAFLEEEAERIGKMNPNVPDGLEILMSRYWISRILLQYYTNARMPKEAQRTQEELRSVQQDVTKMHEQWDYQRQR